MRDYLYDGSFEGLLTCIYDHYYVDKAAGIYTEDSYQQSLLHPCTKVISDEEKASRVATAIDKKISKRALRVVYSAWLSTVDFKEMIILNYVVLGFRRGAIVDSLRGESAVFAMHSIIKKISVEKERMLQFVRFSAVGSEEKEVLYAEVEPDHDVLELVGDHFAERFSTETFIIYDVSRGKAILSSGGRWYITEFSPESIPDFTEAEKDFRKLWKEYYEHIAIRERKNTALRQKFMPLRYARHITELTELSSI